MSKDKIIDKLGYTPANESAVSASIAELDSDISSLEKIVEDYIKNHPDIVEDGSGEVIFTDEADNIIAKFDAEGLHTTNVEAESFVSKDNNLIINDIDGNIIFKVDEAGTHTTKLELASGDVDTQLQGLNADLAEHSSKTEVHVTAEDKQKWNNKSDFSGNYSELVGAPDIVEDESGEVSYVDEAGNIIFKIDGEGAHTTKLELASGDIDTQFLAQSAALAEHTSNTVVHVTAGDKETWNNKSDFSGDFNDLKNSPIQEDSSGEVVYTDESGNIIFKINNEGAETTELKLSGGKVDERLVGLTVDLSEHTSNTNIHITKAERENWNAKATTEYVDRKVADLVNSAPEALNTLDELAAALGDDENFATTVTNELGKKASQADFVEHEADAVSHITASERAFWNDKDYGSLTNAPNIAPEDNEDCLLVTDSTGNIVLKVGNLDEADRSITGLETTTVKAENANIGNVYTKTEVDAKTYTINANAEDDDVVILTGESGANSVKYKATHASSGVVAGTYKSVTVDARGHITAGTNPDTLNGFGITDAYTKSETDSLVSGYKYNISASASDDDVIVLEGTGGANAVSYTASHAKTNKAGTYTKVVVNGYGHITNGSAPTAIADLGITNVYTKNETDSAIAIVDGRVTAHEGAVQQDLSKLKKELSEEIVSESDSWTIVDTGGNILLKAGKLDEKTNGLETTTIIANTATIGNVYNKTEVDSAVSSAKHTITANASDDDIVILNGTSGANSVSYSASHANSGVTPGKYNSVTVDARGHITSGEHIDVYTKSESDALVYTITANAEDDDVVVLKGTSGSNAVTYKASHANSGVTAGEYTKMSVNAKGHITAGSKPTAIADLGITNVYTKTEVDAKVSGAKHAISAGASDDDVVILTGTGGDNAVSYSASHANSGVTAGTYKSVTVNAKGHVTAGTNPTTISGFGITDAYTKKETDSAISVVNTRVTTHETNVRTDLANLKKELSEEIVSESDSWTLVDDGGRILLKAGKLDENTNGLETTTILASNADIGNIYNKSEVDALVSGTKHTITANASDDDVVVLKGTSGANAVSYSASHANSGVTAGSYHKVTVNAKGHVTGGSNPTTLSGHGITDAYTKSEVDSLIAPLPNQNAFSNIAVSGQTTVAADAATDTVTFAGSNVTITTDATNDKVTFTVADGSTSKKGIVQLTDSTSSTSTTTAATPKNVKAAYDLANAAKADAAAAASAAEAAKTYADNKDSALKTELSESIVSEASEWHLVDDGGNIVLKAGKLDNATSGLETTNIVADNANIGNIYTKTEVDSAIAGAKYTITANAEDDDVVVLAGTSGNNTVKYKATHANSGVTAGTYRSVTVNAKGHITSGSNPTTVAGYGITDTYTKTQTDAAIAGATYTITANAEDDDVVVLTGTSGSNSVKYKATHANSGVTAGTYKSVTVNAKGHVTAGSNPTTLAGYGITNAYTSTEVDARIAELSPVKSVNGQTGAVTIKLSEVSVEESDVISDADIIAMFQ